MARSKLVVKVRIAWWFRWIYLPALKTAVFSYALVAGRRPEWIEPSVNRWINRAISYGVESE